MCDWPWCLAEWNWVCRISQSSLTTECLSSNRTSYITSWLIAHSICISKCGLVQFLSVFGGRLRFSWSLACNHTGKGNPSLGGRTQMACSWPSTPLSLSRNLKYLVLMVSLIERVPGGPPHCNLQDAHPPSLPHTCRAFLLMFSLQLAAEPFTYLHLSTENSSTRVRTSLA